MNTEEQEYRRQSHTDTIQQAQESFDDFITQLIKAHPENKVIEE